MQRKQKGSNLSFHFFNFLKYTIVTWIGVNFMLYLNLKFYFLLFPEIVFIPTQFTIFIFSIIIASFISIYIFEIKNILSTKDSKLFPLKETINIFLKDLSFYEKTMYIFFNLLLFLFLASFSAATSFYIIIFLGKSAGVIFYLLFLLISLIILVRIFKTQKFKFFKMGFVFDRS